MTPRTSRSSLHPSGPRRRLAPPLLRPSAPPQEETGAAHHLRALLLLVLLALSACVSPPVIPSPSPDHLHHDFDADGFCEQSPCQGDAQPGDCDDEAPLVFPGAEEACDGLDTDCDGSLGEDEVDGDGDGSLACADCDDADPTIHPGADEGCDGLDTDCDGALGPDEVDADGDGTSTCAGDCDDADPDSHPGAVELCDGIDNDCDEAVPADEVDGDGDGFAPCAGDCDDDDPDRGPADLDGDGFDACLGPDGLATSGDEDCDDTDPALHPADLDGDGYDPCWGADGLASTGDEDCDDDDPALNPADTDGDGFDACWGTDGVPGTGDEDCDDDEQTTFPGAIEVCDGVDNDCDGVADNGLPTLDWYPDLDQDGWGDSSAAPIIACDGAQPMGQVLDNTDCDDLEQSLNHDDADGDSQDTCAGDCDDADATVSLGATEVCDGLDNDCDGYLGADEGDADGDGWMPCEGDCDDADASSNPGATEVTCDGVDNDCDVATEDAPDGDADGWSLCEDCDDLDASVHPGATEVWGDDVDQDCDGVAPLFIDDFSGGSIDYSLWAEHRFTSGHSAIKTIDLVGGQLELTVRSDSYGWTEEAALRSVESIDISYGTVVIEYDQPLPSGPNNSWANYWGMSDEPEDAHYFLGGAWVSSDHPPKSNVAYVGYCPNNKLLAEYRVGATQEPTGYELTDYFPVRTLGGGTIHVEVRVDSDDIEIIVDGTTEYLGPHYMPFSDAYMFFGNYSDQTVTDTAWFDNIEVRRE